MPYFWLLAAAVPLALLVDHRFGEPPVRVHPVVWMGNYLGWAGHRVAPVGGPVNPSWVRNAAEFLGGALLWSAGALLVVALAWAVQWQLLQWAAGAAWQAALALLGLAVLLKPMLAWNMLRSEVRAVEQALDVSLQAGRARLQYLVSRDVANLRDTDVRESAIETLAENLNDSVVAPVFWFVLLGLPGAALYRFANTADAMWGYRGVRNGQRWEWAGKWAARVDDALSWLPARITAVLLLVASALVSGGSWRGWRSRAGALAAEARRTPSPNSGWPMAAMALALEVRLHKPQVYALNAAARLPTRADTHRAIAIANGAVWLNLLVALLCTAALSVVVQP